MHPDYVESTVRCTCGNEFVTRSTRPPVSTSFWRPV
ncbi:MAG: 50S ribosomal protein L31 [Solirubrobacterales bacterium]